MKRLAFVFPGQGSQFSGMGKELYANFPIAANIFDNAAEILGFDLKKLCFEGDIKELSRTENAQPAILTLSVALFRAFEVEVQIPPYLAAGHSLGEYSALTCAKALSFDDSIRLVQLRGQLMNEASIHNPGGMAAIIGASREMIEEICRKCSKEDNLVTIANHNSPTQIVISGHHSALQSACEKFTEYGVRVAPLEVSGAFHSPLMREAAERFEAELEKVIFNYPVFPVISNITAKPYPNIESIPALLKEQITSCVQWNSTVEYLISQEISTIVELGPKNVLRKLIEKIIPGIEVFSTNTEDDLYKIYQLNADEFADKRPNILERCLTMAITTPNTNWNNDEYEKGVIIPYRKIKDCFYTLAENNQEPTIDQMRNALRLLKTIFTTKMLPEEIQNNCFQKILEQTGYRHQFSESDWQIAPDDVNFQI